MLAAVAAAAAPPIDLYGQLPSVDHVTFSPDGTRIALVTGKAEARQIDPGRVCIVGGSYGGYAALAGVTLQSGIYACAVSLAGPSDLRSMLSDEVAANNGTRNATLRYWQRYMGAASPVDPALDAISPAKLADRAKVPILLIHGQDDTVVADDQSRKMAEALRRAGRPAEMVTLKGEDHWLSRTETRRQMLNATITFLAKALPPSPGAETIARAAQ